MSRFNTGNPLGSGDPRDLDDNAKNMDLAMNSTDHSWADRFQRSRLTYAGMQNQFNLSQESRERRFNDFISASGYQFLGDYAPGIEITEYNQLVRDANGEFWRLSGQVELPYTTTGAGIPEDDALVPAGDAVLRQDLANPDKGAAMVARGVVAVDSIADLLALPEGQRREGLRYLVKGYHAGSDLGGGEFYYDASRVGENDNGTVLNGFVRLTEGLVASPYWFGLPLESEDVDYTAELQAVISHPRFEFPKGFKCSTSTLYPVSNTRGFFGDAHFILLPGSDNFTAVMSFETREGVAPENIYYVGGTLDGNRGRESGEGPGGQDGGLHCCSVYSGKNVQWHYPKFINAATDGLYINQAPGEVVSGFDFYNPASDNCSRQGLSIIECESFNFYDSAWRNTNGKSPESGIDIEPNVSDLLGVSVNFYGDTICEGNKGNGFMIISPVVGGQYNARFDRLICRNNDAASFRMFGDGRQFVRGEVLDADGLVSIENSEYGNFKFGVVSCRAFRVANTGDGAEVEADIDELTCGLHGLSTTILEYSPFRISGVEAASRRITIGKLICFNAAESDLARAGLAEGPRLDLQIKQFLPRTGMGLLLYGEGGSSRISAFVDTPMRNNAVYLHSSSSGWDVSCTKTVADGNTAVNCFGTANNLRVKWHDADALLVRVAGSKNRIKVQSMDSSSVILELTSLSSMNMVSGSFLDRITAGSLVTDNGVDNVFVGNYPPQVNTVTTG